MGRGAPFDHELSAHVRNVAARERQDNGRKDESAIQERKPYVASFALRIDLGEISTKESENQTSQAKETTHI